MLVTGFWELKFFFSCSPLLYAVVCLCYVHITNCVFIEQSRETKFHNSERAHCFLHIFLSVCVVRSTRSHIAVLAWHSMVYVHRDRMIYFLLHRFLFFFYSWSNFIAERFARCHCLPICSVIAVALKVEKKENRLSNSSSLIVTPLVTKSMIINAKLMPQNHKHEKKKLKDTQVFNVLRAFEDATGKGCIKK